MTGRRTSADIAVELAAAANTAASNRDEEGNERPQFAQRRDALQASYDEALQREQAEGA